MRNRILLWIDMKPPGADCRLQEGLARHWRVHACTQAGEIGNLVDEARPRVLCFDYEYPDAAGLARLQDTKLRHPSLPILMFTAQSTPELAIWALRTRVWDYFVKPVSVGEVARRLNILARVYVEQQSRGARNVFMPERMIPTETSEAGTDGASGPTLAAIDYLDAHLGDKIALRAAADCCGMDPYRFSRVFRKEHGMTFRDFVILRRLREAALLLAETNQSILDIACRVGFGDPSHFTRMFRRSCGMTPSAFRATRRGPSAPERTACSEGVGLSLAG